MKANLIIHIPEIIIRLTYNYVEKLSAVKKFFYLSFWRLFSNCRSPVIDISNGMGPFFITIVIWLYMTLRHLLKLRIKHTLKRQGFILRKLQGFYIVRNKSKNKL